jgi:two-component system NarL family sensor kinase
MSLNSFRISVLFILHLIVSSSDVFAKEKILSKNEITLLINDANKNLNNLDFEKSLLKLRVALNHANLIKDNNLIANVYLHIAANFDELSDSNKALFYYNLGLHYAKLAKNNTLKNQFYNNLGNIYCFDKKQYSRGIYYYKKSLLHSQKIADKEQLLLTNLNLAWALFDIDKYEEGLTYLNYINKFQSIDGNESSIVALHMLNGMFYAKVNNVDKAKYHFEKAIKLGTIGNEKSDLSYSYQEYSKFLNKINEPGKAYQCLLFYNKITEQLNNEEKRNKATIIGVNLELDQYKREIDKIEIKYKSKENLLLEEQAKNKKIVLSILFLILCISIFVYFFFQNIQLKEKNKLKNLQSIVQEKIINASIDGQELERKKIAAFLHDNISSLLSSAGMHLRVFSSNNTNQCEEITKTKHILDEAHKQIRNLSHELMPTLLMRFGLLFALEDLCEKTSNSKLKIDFQSTVYNKKRYNEEFETKLYFITAELINNIIKHSYASFAKISINETEGKLHIIVTDNGNGFVNNEYELTDGFGINQIRARIKNLKGDFNIHSILNKETIISLIIPIKE